MHHEALSTYLSGKEFYNNSNAIYETLEQDPLFKLIWSFASNMKLWVTIRNKWIKI